MWKYNCSARMPVKSCGTYDGTGSSQRYVHHTETAETQAEAREKAERWGLMMVETRGALYFQAEPEEVKTAVGPSGLRRGR